MKKLTILTFGMALAMCAGSLPAFADGPSIPVWSGAPIATPGDGTLNGMNPTNATVTCHGHTKTADRGGHFI